MNDQELLTMLKAMREEAWNSAVWIAGRIIDHGVLWKASCRPLSGKRAKALETGQGLARLMHVIQIAELGARKRGFNIPWPERKDITGTLDVLGVTDHWHPESFDRLTSPADEIHARALGIRL